MRNLLVVNDWAARGQCADRTDVMFAEDSAPAKALCEGCPVKRKCLDYALDHDIDYGVWGGLDFAERTTRCPVCRGDKDPSRLGCNGAHTLTRLARLIELQRGGDHTVSVSTRTTPSAPTSPGCVVLRGRSHSSPKAYREGCRCAAARRALYDERAARPPATPKPDRTTRDRFMSFVQVDPDGHWWWTGSTNGSGYGNFWDGQRVVRAHLFAYTTFVGPLPPLARLRAGGTCQPRKCVNPEHHHLVGVHE